MTKNWQYGTCCMQAHVQVLRKYTCAHTGTATLTHITHELFTKCSDDAAVCTVTYTLQHVWNVHFKYPRVRYKALTSGSQ